MKSIIASLLMLILIPLAVSAASTDHFTRKLSTGSTGKDVKDLQTILTLKGFLPKKPSMITGTFGPKTKAAVIKYQRSVGITASGTVGPLTRTLLNADILSETLTNSTSSQAFKVPAIKKCPEEKIENIRPTPMRYHFGSTTPPETGYYIFKGERREIKEFDANWVNKNCTFPVNIVY